MTAPLPPLPDCMPTVNALDQLFRQRHNDDDVIRLLIPVMRAAQKLAVREALEQAAQETIKAANEQKNWSLSAVLAAFSIRIRAMLKEYE